LKSACARIAHSLRRFAGKRDGGEFLDWESGRITSDFDGSKITAYRVRAVSKNSVERFGHQLIDVIE
jgi:hypothetical protein